MVNALCNSCGTPFEARYCTQELCAQCSRRAAVKKCNDSRKEKTKEYAIAHRDSHNEASRRYKEKNKEKYKTIASEYGQRPDVKLRTKYRSRILGILKKYADPDKSKATLDIIGCTYLEFVEHLQNTAPEGFSWEVFKQGDEYQIDHIKPLVEFDMSDAEDVKRAFNWSNTRIVTKLENLRKWKHSVIQQPNRHEELHS